MAVPSLERNLDGIRAKVRRARNHINALRRSLHRFRDRDPYSGGVEEFRSPILIPGDLLGLITVPTGNGVGVTITARSTHVDLTLTLIPKPGIVARTMPWSILMGEVVHNLSSALDNLSWELARACTPLWPKLPPGASSDQRRVHQHKIDSIAFPYAKTVNDWKGHLATTLYTVPDPEILTILKKAQPLYAWEKFRKDPEKHPLALLHELWNGDKHHTVNLAVAGFEFQGTTVRIPELFGPNTYLSSEVIRPLGFRPIKGKTEVAGIRVRFPHPIQSTVTVQVKSDVYVQPTYSLAIVFDEGTCAPGENALDIVSDAATLIEALITTFK